MDAVGAEVLHAVLAGHLRTGRRYLRVDVGGCSTLDEAGWQVLCDAHLELLAQRGTPIITGATPEVAQAKAVDPPLFTLAVTEIS